MSMDAEADHVRRLFEAIAAGDAAEVGALVGAGVDVNARGPDGDTPLVTAAELGDLAIVEALIDAEADVNLPDEEGNVPLAYALMRQDPGPARALLDAGAETDRPGLLATAAAHAPLDTVRSLLDRGADPNAADGGGRTPLLAACAAARLATAELLLDRGADVRARDGEGATALLALLEGASRASLLPDVAALRSHADRSIERFRPIVEEAVDRGRNEPAAAHEIALPPGFDQVFRAVVDGGARIDAVDEIGRNALAIAVCEGYPAWVVQALLRRGADPHAPDDDGLTAKDFAAVHPSEAVRELLARGYA